MTRHQQNSLNQATDQSNSTAAIILAGGKSSRMGKDKALLKLGNEILLARLVRLTDPLVAQIVIMLSERLQLPDLPILQSPKITIGRDTVAEQGPLQGIADAVSMLSAETKVVLVLSCDLPFITREWMGTMLAQLKERDQLDAVCTAEGNRLNPLIGAYRVSTLKNARQQLALGKSSCQVLLDNSRVFGLAPPSSKTHIITNINTPEEYENALLRIAKSC